MNTASTDRFETGVLKDEFKGIDLGDERRNRRICTLIEQLGKQPRNSIPSAIGGWSETKAAYSVLAHPQVTAQKILEPHYEATQERIKQHPVVLVAQDTTEMDYTGKMDSADQPHRRHSGRRKRKTGLVSLQMADRSIF